MTTYHSYQKRYLKCDTCGSEFLGMGSRYPTCWGCYSKKKPSTADRLKELKEKLNYEGGDKDDKR